MGNYQYSYQASPDVRIGESMATWKIHGVEDGLLAERVHHLIVNLIRTHIGEHMLS